MSSFLVSFLDLQTISLSLVVIFITIFYLLVRKNPRAVKYLSQFPGPQLLPIIGNATELLGPSHEMLQVFEKWFNTYGGCYRFWLLNQPYIVLADAKSVEKILSSNVNIEKNTDYELMHAWLGTGLLTSTGAKWSSRRKLLTPAFHFKILDDFLEVFNEQSSTLVQVLTKECCDGNVVDIFPYVTRCALDIICETAMGRNIHAQSQRDSEYVRALFEISEMIIMRFVRPWLKINLIWKMTSQHQQEKKLLKTLHAFTTKVIQEKKLERKQRQSEDKNKVSTSSKDDDIFMTKKRRLAFLDLLLEVSEDGKILTDQDIREETDTFMFEGHDTTAANLGWTLLLLAANPECQEKVYEELNGIFGAEPDRDITNSDLAQMKYLELCIKESLRIYPSVPFFARQVNKDIVFDDARIVPTGTNAMIFPYLLHRDPSVFPNPEEFRPERFMSENKRNPYAYTPFSAGPRNCIGQKFATMEEKVILSKILLNFVLEAGENRKNIILVPDIILRPMNGINLKLKRRL